MQLDALKTTRLVFEKLDAKQKAALILEPLKKWYLIGCGPDLANKYFQYFTVETDNLTGDSQSAKVKFQSPWESLNCDFEVEFTIPYSTIAETVPNDLFAEKILDMTPFTTDEAVLTALTTRANQKIANFTDDFALANLDVVNQTVAIVAKVKSHHQIYQPKTQVVLSFNVGKVDINDFLG